MRRQIFISIVVLMMMLVLTGSAWASQVPGGPSNGGVVLVDSDWVLPPGRTHQGDVLVIRGNATVERGATLIGDLAVISGDAAIRGMVYGDVSVVGGKVVLGPGAEVLKDISVLSGSIERDPTAVVRGTVHYGTFSSPLLRVPIIETQTHYPPMFPVSLWRLFWGIFSAFFSALVVAAISALIIAVWPDPTRRVSQVIQRAAVPAFFTGLASSVAVLILALLLVLTICLSPFGLVLLLGWLSLGLLGWAALGYIVGEYIWQALKLPNSEPLWPTALGAFVLTLLSTVPCVGTLFFLSMGAVAIGAVVLSNFGTRVPDYGASSGGNSGTSL